MTFTSNNYLFECFKMKEEVVAIESTQQLSTERARLQLEKYQLEQSRSEVERKNYEISELQQKVSPMH